MDTIRLEPGTQSHRRPEPADPWQGRTVPALVAATVARQPDAVALIHRHTPVSYRELDLFADACAGALYAAGVRAGDYVPIRQRRSVPLIALALGVLKLGAAYALMDPDWPVERIRDEIEQLGAGLIVSDEPAALPGLPVPVWQPPADLATQAPLRYPATAGHGSDACTVFFTSGTTGRPKGAVSPHSGVIRLAADRGFFDLVPGTVIPNAAALPWDLFSLEIWGSLIQGTTVVLVDDQYISGDLLRELIAVDGVTATFATTSLFNMLVDEDLSSFTGLRRVVTGGERLSALHCRNFLAAHPGITLVNAYGPVEATVYATSRIITPADCDNPDGIPIGTDAAQTGVHILDGVRLCGPDELGEICVSGPGLAREYVGEPELTAQKFVTVPLDGQPVRIYRTGDLGLRDSDGVVHFRGRADRQVKIRGYRIEPHEVEAVIAGLPGVRTAVVLPRMDEGGACVGMLGFYIPQTPDPQTPDSVPDGAGLRDMMRERVAAYQIPDRLVAVDALPLHPNGKLDGAALLRMAGDPPARAVTVEPVGDTDEVTLAVREVVAAILRLPPTAVPDHESLSALGASSLDLGRIAARLGERQGRPVPLSQLFRTPTVGGLAGWLRDSPAVPPAAPDTADDPWAPAPLSSLQALMITEYLVDPDKRDLNCVFAWRVAGRPDRAALRTAFAALHHRHPALRARYDLAGGGTATPLDVPPPAMLESLVRTESDAVDQLARDCARPFAPDRGQVWRPVFVAVRDTPVTLIGVAAHHVAVDGGSGPAVAADLAAAYEAARQGREPEPPTVTLAGIAAARDAHLGHVDLGWQRDLLRRTLTGVPDLAFPPVVGAEAAPAVGRLCRPIDPALRAGVEAVAARTQVSPFVVYLTAYAQSLAELTGQVDFGIGTSFNRRSQEVLYASVSCLIDILCLRPAVGPELASAAAIARTSAAVAAAFSAQDVSIHECAQLAGALGGRRQPLFQTMFLLQDNPDCTMALDGLPAGYFRPPYPGVPSELVTEVWPDQIGGATLLVGYRAAAVGRDFCEQLADRWLARLDAMTRPTLR